MEIFKLFGTILLKDEEAIKQLDKVDEKADGVGGKLGTMIGTAAKWGAGLAVGAGVAAGGLLALVTKTSEAASEINDMSVRTGISTKNLQELQFATGQVGVSFDAITGAAGKLTKTMGSADEGNKAAIASFKQMGIDIKDAHGSLRTMDDVLPELLKKLADMPNATERNAEAMKFFGKGAMELAPLLAGGSAGINELTQKAHDLGLVLSDEAINANDQFGDSMDQVTSSLGAVGMKIGTGLLPIAQSMVNWFLTNMPIFQVVIGTVFDAIGKSVEFVGSIFSTFGNLISKILNTDLNDTFQFATNKFQEFQEFALNAWNLITQGLKAEWEIISTEAKIVFDALLEFWKNNGQAIMDNITNTWDTIWSVIQPVWNIISDVAIQVFGALKTFFDENSNDIKNFIVTTWDLIWSIINPIWDTILSTATFIFNNLSAFWDAWGKDILNIFRTMWNVFSTIFNTAIKVITDIFKIFAAAFKGDWKGLWDGIKTLFSDIWIGIGKIIDKYIDYIQEVFSTFAKVAHSILVGAFNGIKNGILNVFEGIESGIKNSVNAVTGFINGMINSATNAVNTVINLANKLPMVDIKKVDAPQIPKLATGGDIISSGRVMVGEKGPEFLDLPVGARVTPLDKANNNNSGITLNIYDPHLFNDNDADKFGDLIVNRLKTLGVVTS